jgi:hypothetical protein
MLHDEGILEAGAVAEGDGLVGSDHVRIPFRLGPPSGDSALFASTPQMGQA